MSSALLLETLKGLSEARAGLGATLMAAHDQLFVYYICPLSNLRGITTMGILPNAVAPKDRVDLSGQSVQAMREVKVLR